MTMIWIGACGFVSSNAIILLSSKTIFEDSSLFAILQNRHSSAGTAIMPYLLPEIPVLTLVVYERPRFFVIDLAPLIEERLICMDRDHLANEHIVAAQLDRIPDHTFDIDRTFLYHGGRYFFGRKRGQ